MAFASGANVHEFLSSPQQLYSNEFGMLAVTYFAFALVLSVAALAGVWSVHSRGAKFVRLFALAVLAGLSILFIHTAVIT